MEKQLQSILDQPDTVLFIGSGISCWSGLPSWSRLIEELADFLVSKGQDPSLVKKEIERGELLQAVSYGFDKLTRPQIGEFIRQACRLGKAQPHEIHCKLVTLGPRCFVTTNYDRLLEASFQLWQPDRYYRVVTNRQLAETAEINGARSRDFLFKPHGDAEDVESIILTREQYRALAPGGERYNALETLRILLASRPFVYLGFGLRDPDFFYVRDLLANTYKGGIRDHYAIMADITDAEADYWRRNYGIHLVNYPTILRPDKSRDHRALLELLDRFGSRHLSAASMVSPSSTKPDLDGTVLALARHAARLSRVEKPFLLFPLHVHIEEKPHGKNIVPDHFVYRYDGSPVEALLDNGPDKLILIGTPGAGKSFAIRHSAARLAEKLHDCCLAEPFEKNRVFVPMVADLKLYKGDLWKLIEKTLPVGLSLTDLISRFSVKVYLDAINEMPREYIENGLWEADFSHFLERASQASIIITSRAIDELRKLDIPVFCLDEVNKSFVEAELKKCGFKIRGIFKKEILSILQKPFFFHIILNGVLSLTEANYPKDIFNAFLTRLTSSFRSRFGTTFDVTAPLASLAYDSINKGEEAFPIATAIQLIHDQIATFGINNISAIDVVNWLIGRDLLLPFSGGRVSFFHQSITEYLAATELSRFYREEPYILRKRLALRRWDQALFLTLSLLPPEEAEKFIESIIEMDFDLALSAVKFMEFGRDEIVERLLREIPKRVEADWEASLRIQWALESDLPISPCHESLLRILIKLGDMVGGAAASRLLRLHGEDLSNELYELLIENCDDYNFCSNIARSLVPFISASDIPHLVSMADRVEERLEARETENYEGFDSALGEMLKRLVPKKVFDAFFDHNKPLDKQKVRLSVLCDFLWKSKSNEALALAGELILAGVAEASFSMHMIANYSDDKTNLNWSSFTESHVTKLIQQIADDKYGEWAIDALGDICMARPDLVTSVHKTCIKSEGILRVVLLNVVTTDDQRPVFDALNDLLNFSPEKLSEEPAKLLSHLELDWAGHEELFINLLRLRNLRLASSLIETTGVMYEGVNLGTLEIGPIGWWLEWLKESTGTEDGWWFQNKLSRLFANKLNPETWDAFLNEFNKQDSPYRSVLAHILSYKKDLSTDHFDDDAILFLLAGLSKKRNKYDFKGHLFVDTATESFVNERLLPLLPNAEEPLRSNLIQVLKEIGKRHGRRYVAT